MSVYFSLFGEFTTSSILFLRIFLDASLSNWIFLFTLRIFEVGANFQVSFPNNTINVDIVISAASVAVYMINSSNLTPLISSST
jgi:hypothetical protein